MRECDLYSIYYILLNNISFTLRVAIKFTKFVEEIHARKSVSNFNHIVSKFLILNTLHILNFPFSSLILVIFHFLRKRNDSQNWEQQKKLRSFIIILLKIELRSSIMGRKKKKSPSENI